MTSFAERWSRAGLAVRRLLEAFGVQGEINTVLRGAGVVMLIQVVGSALAYTTQVLLARWMGAFEFGIFIYAWSWATLLPVIGSFGLNKAVVRFVPEYIERRDWGALSGVIRRTRILVFTGGLFVVAGAAALVVFLIADHIAEYYLTSLYLGFASVPLLALLTLYSETSRGFGWPGMAYSPAVLIRPGLFVVAVALLPLSSWPTTSVNVLALAFLSCLLTVIALAVQFERRLPDKVRWARPDYRSRYWLRISLPVFLADGIVLVLWQLDIVMLGAILGPSEVAVYNACVKSAGLAFFFFTALAAMAVPKFAGLYASGERERLQGFVSSVARWIFFPSALVVVGLMLTGRWILAIFGPTFVTGYSLLMVLAVGYLLSAVTGPANEYLMVSGNHDAIVLANASAAILNVVLNALLIPLLGTMGAGVSSFLALVVLTVWLYLLVRRRLGLNAFFLARG